MKTKWIMIISTSFILCSCNGQDKNNNDVSKNLEKKPKIDYKVNKEYDENGNLIRYDSTYTYYYSNMDSETLNSDSIFGKLNEHFSSSNLFNNSFFDNFYNHQDLITDDFFKEDFFRNNLNRNDIIIQDLFEKMDSIKNEFFLREYPPSIERDSIDE